MTTRKALITGINGQDGSYLAEMLLDKGYEVHGIVRREALEDSGHRLANIHHLIDKVTLHPVSVANQLAVHKVVSDVVPDECYHLAAASFVSYGFEDEAAVLTYNFNATHYLLSSLKEAAPHCRLYFAASSELFGDAQTSPQHESTPFNPRSMYGISKLAAYHLVRNFRKQNGIFACAGILYNHESPRRGFEFVTRKITSTVAKIHLGLADHIELGNLEAKRDWGYAPEYVQAMQLMLAQKIPDDYVIATGKLHSVKEFLEIAFGVVHLDYTHYVQTNPSYYRQEETVPLCGDASKATRVLGWRPTKPFSDIVEEMVRHDIALLKGDA